MQKTGGGESLITFMRSCELLAPGSGGIPIRLQNDITCVRDKKKSSKLKNELVSTDYTSKAVFGCVEWCRPNESKIEVHFDWFCRTNLLRILHSSQTQPLSCQMAW